MPDRTLSVLDGSTFVVSDLHGDVIPGEARENGFFSADTRFVSRWILRVGQTPLELLSLNQSTHFDAQFFLTPRVGPEEQAPCSIVRQRLVDHVWMEEITVTNHLHEPSRIRLALEIDADFADLFEVKDIADAERAVSFTHDATSMTLAYRHADFRRSVRITSSSPATITRNGFEYELDLGSGEQWTTSFTIAPHASQPDAKFSTRTPRGSLEAVRKARTTELETWLAGAPALHAQDPTLLRTYRASLSDLAALRMHPDLNKGATMPAAGLPWFMALFGRDSLITSFQALPYIPELAATTLRVLAARQAIERDDFHDEEPERSSTSCVSASSPPAGCVRTRRTSGAPTPPPCSWCCWTNITGGPATTRWSASSSPMPARPSHGSRRAATSTGTATSSTNAAT